MGRRPKLVRTEVPVTFRVGVAGLLFVPAIFLVAGAVFNPEGRTGFAVLGVLLVLFAWCYFSAHAYVAVGERSVQVGLFPLFRKLIRLEQIEAVDLDALAPEEQVRREWGNRGRLSGVGGLLLDCGHSSFAIRFSLTDGRSFSIGLGGDVVVAREQYERVGAAIRRGR